MTNDTTANRKKVSSHFLLGALLMMTGCVTSPDAIDPNDESAADETGELDENNRCLFGNAYEIDVESVPQTGHWPAGVTSAGIKQRSDITSDILELVRNVPFPTGNPYEYEELTADDGRRFVAFVYTDARGRRQGVIVSKESGDVVADIAGDIRNAVIRNCSTFRLSIRQAPSTICSEAAARASEVFFAVAARTTNTLGSAPIKPNSLSLVAERSGGDREVIELETSREDTYYVSTRITADPRTGGRKCIVTGMAGPNSVRDLRNEITSTNFQPNPLCADAAGFLVQRLAIVNQEPSFSAITPSYAVIYWPNALVERNLIAISARAPDQTVWNYNVSTQMFSGGLTCNVDGFQMLLDQADINPRR